MKKSMRMRVRLVAALSLMLAMFVGVAGKPIEVKAATIGDLESFVEAKLNKLEKDEDKIAVLEAAGEHTSKLSGNDYTFGTNSTKISEKREIKVGDKTFIFALVDDKSANDDLDAAIKAMEEKYKSISEDNDKNSVGFVKNELAEMTDAFNVKADVKKGADSLNGTQEFLEMILGVICYIAIIAMAIFTAFDVCYITMPMFKSKMDEKAMQGGAGTRNSRHGGAGGGEGRKVVVVTDDAIQAVEESGSSGKNPLTIYLKKRIVSYVGIAIVLYVLLSGNITLVVELSLKAVSGLIEQLNKISG